MSGWLSLTLAVTVAAREGLREVNVFEVMELRTIIGLMIGERATLWTSAGPSKTKQPARMVQLRMNRTCQTGMEATSSFTAETWAVNSM